MSTTKQGSGEATARPWSTVLGDYGSLPTNNYLAVYGADGSCVAYVLAHKAFWERGDRDHPVEANARLIVTAVNAFDDLVAALQACLPLFDHVACGEVEDRVREALAKAGVQS